MFSVVFFTYCFFFFNDTATTEIYTLSLHDALPIFHRGTRPVARARARRRFPRRGRSEEHTSELQSRLHLVCRLLLEKKHHLHPHVSLCTKKDTTHNNAVLHMRD